MANSMVFDDGMNTKGEGGSPQQPETRLDNPTSRKDAKLPRRVQAAFLIAVSAGAWIVIFLAILPFL